MVYWSPGPLGMIGKLTCRLWVLENMFTCLIRPNGCLLSVGLSKGTCIRGSSISTTTVRNSAVSLIKV